MCRYVVRYLCRRERSHLKECTQLWRPILCALDLKTLCCTTLFGAENCVLRSKMCAAQNGRPAICCQQRLRQGSLVFHRWNVLHKCPTSKLQPGVKKYVFVLKSKIHNNPQLKYTISVFLSRPVTSNWSADIISPHWLSGQLSQISKFCKISVHAICKYSFGTMLTMHTSQHLQARASAVLMLPP